MADIHPSAAAAANTRHRFSSEGRAAIEPAEASAVKGLPPDMRPRLPSGREYAAAVSCHGPTVAAMVHGDHHALDSWQSMEADTVEELVQLYPRVSFRAFFHVDAQPVCWPEDE